MWRAAVCFEWTALPATISLNGIPQSAITSVISCQALCISVSNCVAIEFDTTKPTQTSNCYLHLSVADLNVITQAPPSVTQYRLTRLCQASVSPSSKRLEYIYNVYILYIY